MTDSGKKYPVDESLSDVLSHFYVIKLADSEPLQSHHLAPNLEIMIVFSFGTPVLYTYGKEKLKEHTLERVGILGPLRRMMSYELKAGADLLILPFIYNGFSRFSSLTAYDADRASLQWNFTQRLEALWEKLAALTDPEKRIAALNACLTATLADNDPAAKPLLDSLTDIHNPVVNPVRVIAARTSLSERTVQLRFKKYTGYSPKELVRFLRFKQVMSFILQRLEEKIDWFNLIMQMGYHDQSHLIKDFKYYTGVSPRQFVKLNREGNFCVGRE